LALHGIGDGVFEGAGLAPLSRGADVAVGADLVDVPVDLEVVAVGVLELDRELAAGATSALEVDGHVSLAQPRAGPEDLVEIEIGDDERTKPFLEAGRDLFNRRQGQLNLSCAQCHDDNWGQKLAGAPVPQGHATGYPLYRLEWQSLGSLQRRLRNCIVGMRAEPYAFGAPEYVDLELYLMWRARGMKVETPAVRP